MRKLLDWIADKLGYQRKFNSVPIQFPPLPQELWDDAILPPIDQTEALSTLDWPPDYFSVQPFDPSINPNWKLEIYEDDHGSPGKEISDDLFIIEE